MRIQAIVLDVGETLVSEGRLYATWADWLGIQRHVFFAVLGAVIARGGREREAFEWLRPGIDLAVERDRRAAAGVPDVYAADDLYSDVRDCLSALAEQGLRIGLAGERPAQAVALLRSLGIEVDFIAASREWKLDKPSPWFFARLVIEAGCRAGEILYVGDRIEDDIKPAQDAGLLTAFIRRGPWGHIQENAPEVARCRFVLQSLAPLPRMVADHNAASGPAPQPPPAAPAPPGAAAGPESSGAEGGREAGRDDSVEYGGLG